jgi:cytochrome c oxidase cbb3-type subunit 1
MNESPPRPSPDLATPVRRHALGWLVAGNAVGVLLAAELLWPSLGDALAPLSYGRWMPLHLNWQLYGWCAVPLVGGLFAGLLDRRHPQAARHASLALVAWSLALALGGVSWLGGVTSGKLFLDWAGWARPLLPAAMVVLWTVLAAHAFWSWPLLGRAGRWVRGSLLLFLLPVPGLLYWSAGPEIYPSVNPDSGGATGSSLLGSTLGMIAIFGLLPVLFGLGRTRGRVGREFWLPLVASFAAFGLIDHGHTSHHARAQIVGLGLLLVWVPLLIRHLRAYPWCAAAQPWLRAALGWWLLLVVSGWLTFLPGLSERLKFTNWLVAHAHIAMAGLVTSLNFVILNQLDPLRPLGRGVRLWQMALAVQAVALRVLGWQESERPADLFRSEAWTQALYGIRLVSGAGMLVLSARWFRETWARGLRTGAGAQASRFPRMSALSSSPPSFSLTRMSRGLALGAGCLDAGTGLGLVFAPELVLGLMGASVPGAEALIYLRWVGAFVAAVGASYLIALVAGGGARLRAVFEFTIVFRLAAGLFSAVAIARGWLGPVWVSVPLADFALAAVQVWLLRKGVGRDE